MKLSLWHTVKLRFDYGAAVQAGIDHDRLADLLHQVGDSPRLPPKGSFVPVVIVMTQALTEHPQKSGCASRGHRSA